MRIRGTILILLVLTSNAAADEPKTKLDDVTFPDETPGSLIPSAAAPDVASDPTTAAAYQRSLQAYYRYRETAFSHRRDVFNWQLLSSRVIFMVVVCLVGIGVYFSWIQFRSDRVAFRRGGTASATAVPVAQTVALPSTDETPPSKSDPVTSTTFKASTSGIEVSSPVLGVVILTISLAFFYLYLLYVYPIHDAF